MTNDPGDRPDDEQPNPFKGTPFEQIFNAFGGAGGSGGVRRARGRPGCPTCRPLMSQMQAMMAPHEGSVNWDARQGRRPAHRRASSPTPPRPSRQRSEVADALRLADHWLDSATEFPSGVTSTAAWSRAEWVEQTIDVWQRARRAGRRARRVARWATRCRPRRRQMAGPLMGHARPGRRRHVRQPGRPGRRRPRGRGAQRLRHRPARSARAARPRCCPANVARLRRGARRRPRTTYSSTSRCARPPTSGCSRTCRGCAGTCSPRSRTTAAAPPSTCRRSSRRCATSTRPTRPPSRRRSTAGCSSRRRRPRSRPRSTRLETALALVEGWVDEVVGQATESRMPQRRPSCRRRCAAVAPPAVRPSPTFAALVGLELRPRRLRDASALWGSLRSRKGQDARDAVWSHPDLLPTSADLDDPLGFQEGAVPASEALSDDEFDAALAELLDNEPASADGGDPRAARHPVTALHDDALATLRAWRARRPAPGAAAPSGTSTTSTAHPDGLSALPAPARTSRPARWCSRPTARAGAAHAARQGTAVVPPRRPLRAAGRDARRRRRCARASRSPASPDLVLDPEPLHLDAHVVAFCGGARAGHATSTYGSSRWRPPVRCPTVSEESLDVRWWPVDAPAHRRPGACAAGRRPGSRRLRRRRAAI